jgi:hypothetical protein
VKKTRGRPFEKGNKASPGRPKGSRNATLRALDALGDDNAKLILQAQVNLALKGDQRAAELILTRCWPVGRGRLITVDGLPVIKTASDLPKAMNVIVAAIAAGEISAEEGAAVGAVLEMNRKAIETADLDERVRALEASAPARGAKVRRGE